MGFFDRLTGGKARSFPSNASFRLTQEGREKLQDFSGDPKSRILVALESRGTSDLEEISTTSGMSRGEVERMIPGMIRAGYIQYVTGAGEGA